MMSNRISATIIRLKWADEKPSRGDSQRVLIDRL